MKIWVNGCFDILHVGHIDLLESAKYVVGGIRNFRKNTLIVGIDSDKRVKELKGEERPINSQEDRKKMLLALTCVNEVHIFNTADELRQLIKDLKIDMMVVGDDYRNREVIGSENSKNGVVFFEIEDDYSTSNIIEKIKKL